MIALGALGQLQALRDQSLPLLVYSYSSRGFPDVVDRLRHSLPHVPSYLVSLYDFAYVIPPDIFGASDKRIRIWDSGGYETRFADDLSAVYSSFPGLEEWSEGIYVKSARRIPWSGEDILVSFDSYSQGLDFPQQIEQALQLYARVEGEYLKDLVVHLGEGVEPDHLVEALHPYQGEFDILGLLEKEIAPTWVHGVGFISRIRTSLTALNPEQYVPIHVFGCFDPKTVIRFALSGADIFDGLTWMRYLFLNRSTLYKREIEYAVELEQLKSAGSLGFSLMIHNIECMERLRSDLVYAIGSGDLAGVESEANDVKAALECWPRIRGGW